MSAFDISKTRNPVLEDEEEIGTPVPNLGGFDMSFRMDRNVQRTMPEREPEAEPPEFDHDDAFILTMAAGIERENAFAKWAGDKIRGVVPEQFKYDPDYDPAEDEANMFYDVKQISKAGSAAEAEAIRNQIDSENKIMEMIQGNVGGTIGEIIGVVGQPHNLIPLAGATALGAKVTTKVVGAAVPQMGWLAMTAMESGLEVGHELLLHNQQMTRTYQESLLNIAIVGGTTAVIGKASEMLSGPKAIKPPRNRDNPELDDLGDSAGSMRSHLEAEDLELLGGKWATKPGIGPGIRLTKSSAPAGKEIGAELVDQSAFTKGNVEGRTGGVSVEAEANAAAGEVMNHIDALKGFAQESGMVTRNLKGFGFKQYTAFNEEVSRAMRNGDQHSVPKVQEAAEYLRKNVFEPRKARAEELGHTFNESGLADSYLPRMYNNQKIIQNYDGLKTQLNNHYVKTFTKEFGDQKALRASVEADQLKAYTDLKGKQKELTEALSASEKASKELVDEGVTKLNTRLEKSEAELAIVLKGKNKREIARARARRKTIKAEIRSAGTTSRKRVAAHKAEMAKVKKELSESTRKLDAARAKLSPHARTKVLKAERTPLMRKKNRTPIMNARIAKLDKMLADAAAEIKATPVQKAASDAVKEQIMTKADIAREANIAARNTIQNMMGGLPGTHGVGAGLPRNLQQRTLAIKDDQLSTYLENDVGVIAQKYATGMDPYLIMKDRFGDAGLGEQIKRMQRQYQELIDAAATPAEKATLSKQMASDTADVEAMRDRVLRRIQRDIDPTKTATKTVQYIKAYNVSTQLGGIMLSSLPDMARPMMAYGLRSFFTGAMRAMGQAMESWGKPGARGDRTLQVRRTGVASQRLLNSRLLDISDQMHGTNVFADKMNSAWGKISMFDAWTDAMESLTAQAAMDWTLRMGKKLDAGKTLSKPEMMKLSRMGFDMDHTKLFYQKSVTGGNDPVLKYANTLEWGDPDLAKMFEAGIGSDVRRSIVRIGAGDKPLMMDDPMVSLIGQYMSFSMASTNRMLVAGGQLASQGDIGMTSGILSSLMLGATVGASKGWLRGEEFGYDSAVDFGSEALDRTGTLGIWNHGFNLLVRPTYDDMSSRYLARGAESLFGGSTASQIGRAASAYTGAIEGDAEKVVTHGSRLIPFYSNALHMRQLLERLGEIE